MKRSRLGLVVLGLTVVAAAQAQTLYSGAAADKSVSVRSWGGGSVRQTDELGPADPHTIRVSSRNYYQGGLIRFSHPVSFAQAYEGKDNLLKLTVRFPKTIATTTPAPQPGMTTRGGDDDERGGDTGPRGAPTGGRPGVPPGGLGRPGMPPTGMPGMPPGMGQPRPAVAAPATPSTVRLIVTTSDGLHSEAYVDLPLEQARSGGWIPAAIPLQAISGFSRTNKEIVGVTVSADTPSTFFIKEIAVSSDQTPIYADLNLQTDLNLAFGDEYTFVASGYGGATQLKYEWNFDAEHTQGVDADGRSVKRRFRKAGTFVVQVTVSDVYGLKKPFTRSVKVTVNP
ncbi:MAG: PKD domain-containing protein [Armatimonadota bacterium]